MKNRLFIHNAHHRMNLFTFHHVGRMNTEKKSAGLLKTLMIALLSLGIGAGGFWFYTNSIAHKVPSLLSATEHTNQLSAEPYEPIFLEIEPFTVTLRNDIESRVLYTSMTLRITNDDSRERLVRYLPVVRSRILIELNKMNPSSLNSQAELDSAGARIKKAVSNPIPPELMSQDIAEVLFTSFMVQ